MNQELEEIFRLREERDMEIYPEVKEELHGRFHARLREFLRRHRITMTNETFLSAPRADYKNWRRNPH